MVQHTSSREGERLTGHRATDPIAAIATPAGRGGIGVVRVSGADLEQRLAVTVERAFRPRAAVLTNFRGVDGEVIDRGICLFFPAPRSFTGEDVVEYHGHGGPQVLELLLETLYQLGVRPAQPGEFTQRAYLNDKLDLAQAEAVADLINAGSRRAARAALRSLSGVFSRRIAVIDEALLELRVQIEASLDFADEDIDLLADSDIGDRMRAALESCDALLADARQGEVLTRGVDVVIAGAPNVGKSTLMNALSQSERAIVTAVPGTTRDLLHVEIEVDGVPIRLTDTAGIHRTDDPVERIGVARAQAALAQADVVLDVRDVAAPDDAHPAAGDGRDTLVVWNKVDLAASFDAVTGIAISATTGAGLDDLRAAIVEAVGLGEGSGTFSARERHLQALLRCREALARSRESLERAADVAAEELRTAHQALGEIVGETMPDELLGVIFSQFCIGK